MSSILSENDLILKVEQQMKSLLESTEQHFQDQSRIDQVERDLFSQLLDLGETLLKEFVSKAGNGDEGEEVELDGRTLRRSDEPQRRFYASIFGKLEIDRFVYAPGVKKKRLTNRLMRG